MEKCVLSPHNIMGHQTGNVYYAVEINDPVLVYFIRRKIIMQETDVQQYVFMFTTMYHVVLVMKYAHMNN